MAETRGKTPRWVWTLCTLMAASQLVVVLITAYFPPSGAVPSGLHIPDSALFLYCMDMFSSGFESAYATCLAEHGVRSIAYYAFPHILLYGVLGSFGDIVGANHFLLYGISNAAGAFVYLYAVYRFLRQVVPRQDRLAFLLFVLSGGFGGFLYLVSVLAGWNALHGFDSYFFRFAVYELAEGPHLSPVTHFPRLYYTLSLALGFAALTQFHRSRQMRCGAHALYASILMAASSFLYFRLGAFLFGVALCYIWAQAQWPVAQRVRMLAVVALPALLGGGGGALVMSINPSLGETLVDVGNMAMWLSPFLATAALHLLLAAIALRYRTAHLPPLARACAFGAIGYVVTFTVLFALYQMYYGNVLIARDGAVASKISDPALLGFLAGAIVSARSPRGFAIPENWVVLWFLGALACAISAFGQGWFLRFGPQRVEIVLWLPLCILAAQGLQRLPEKEGKAAVGVLVFLGTLSVCVSVLFFQSPVGRVDAQGPFPAWHTEVMNVCDAAAMDALGDGTVLALPPASDIIVVRHGNPVVFGIGSSDLSDRPYVALRGEVETFFAADTTDDQRATIAAKWCVDWVYCGATWPVPVGTRDALLKAAWLDVIYDEGGATVFKIVDPTRTVAG